MFTIFLSAGHNPRKEDEKGVVVKNLVEAKMAEAITDIVYEKLLEKNKNVLLVPNNLSLAGEIEWVNKKAKEDDICLQFHLNSHPSPQVRGTETFYYRNQILAEIFARHISRALGIPNNGYKPDTKSYIGELGWVRKTKCRAVLIEICFLTNTEDVMALDYTKVAKGVLSAFEEINPSPVIDSWSNSAKITETERKQITGLKAILNYLWSKLTSLKLKFGAEEQSQYSLTYKGVGILLLGIFLNYVGVPFTDKNLEITITTVLQVISAIVILIGRYRAGGITPLGYRKFE